ncbi:MAG: mechanosensitive ion channel [Lachnospiraceae bacterium]|nr:mechanosensitive ion channel [Lachnospiraceae bacterium]
MTFFELDTIKGHLGNAAWALIVFALKFILALLILWIVVKVMRKVSALISKSLVKLRMEPFMAHYIGNAARYLVVTITVLTIITKLNIVKESAITAVLASAGVAISLALQGGLSNFAGGILILLLRPFQTNDYIIVPSENLEGSIKKIELYYTTIVTIDNRVIMMPNSKLTDNTIVNVTAMERRLLEIKVGIAYSENMEEAKQILRELVEEEPRFQKGGEQYFVDSLDDSAVKVGFRAWVATEDYIQLRWDMMERIKLKFDEKRIRIPFPQMDVHLHQQEKEHIGEE